MKKLKAILAKLQKKFCKHFWKIESGFASLDHDICRCTKCDIVRAVKKADPAHPDHRMHWDRDDICHNCGIALNAVQQLPKDEEIDRWVKCSCGKILSYMNRITQWWNSAGDYAITPQEDGEIKIERKYKYPFWLKIFIGLLCGTIGFSLGWVSLYLIITILA